MLKGTQQGAAMLLPAKVANGDKRMVSKQTKVAPPRTII